MASIGAWIKKCRQKREWSQSELASQMGVAALSIGNWENSKNFPQELNLQRLEELFAERRPDGSGDLDELLEVLRDSFNGGAGNMKLRDKLGWSENHYWTVRARALDMGKIILGRGQGGSVKIVEETEFERDLEPSFGLCVTYMMGKPAIQCCVGN